LCRELNLASDSIDDIPDRTILRRLVETLEAESGAAAGQPQSTEVLAAARGRLLREAARVSGATNRTLAEVIQRASKGAFTLATLKSLGVADIGVVQAALTELKSLTAA
jgi:hypothetical protein